MFGNLFLIKCEGPTRSYVVFADTVTIIQLGHSIFSLISVDTNIIATFHIDVIKGVIDILEAWIEKLGVGLRKLCV